MPGRERISNSVQVKGTGGRFGDTWGGGFCWSGYHKCTDVVGSGDNAPLYVQHETVQGGRINKPYVGFFSSWFQNYRADMLDVQGVTDHLEIIDEPGDTDAVTQAAARTNPSAPYVDVPVNVLQLGELATLLRGKGRSFIRDLGTNNLMYQFGIVPLVGDLAKMIDFNDQVSRRVGVINRLQSSGGYRKTIGLWSGSNQAFVDKFIQTQGVFIRGDFDVTTSTSVKAHMRWLPQGDYSHLSSPQAQRDLARRAVLGLTFDLSSAWELIPWSWLIDWGTTIGDYFAANRNIIPAVLNDHSIMRHSRTVASWPGYAEGDWSCSGIQYTKETKRRSNSGFVAPVAHLPFLSANQMGIVASLAVTRL